MRTIVCIILVGSYFVMAAMDGAAKDWKSMTLGILFGLCNAVIFGWRV